MKRMIWMAAVCAMAAVGGTAGAADKTYKPDDEGFIRNWLLLDAITLDDSAGNHSEDAQKGFFDKDYVPSQKTATPKEGDKVKVEGNQLTWQAKESEDYGVEFDQADNSLFLGVTYIICDKEMPKLTLAIGSDDSSVWRLNGKEVIRVFEGRGVDKDQNKSEPLTLKEGVNVLSFGVINGGGPTGAAARFLDSSDNPVTKFKVTLTPPAAK